MRSVLKNIGSYHLEDWIPFAGYFLKEKRNPFVLESATLRDKIQATYQVLWGLSLLTYGVYSSGSTFFRLFSK